MRGFRCRRLSASMDNSCSLEELATTAAVPLDKRVIRLSTSIVMAGVGMTHAAMRSGSSPHEGNVEPPVVPVVDEQHVFGRGFCAAGLA